ncbi:ATP-binding protein [sulfur-oxidizing endosymbiont of Gigantopelta aegis]|uniref:ATP-binding protein n=1 Tax=sulfur-oxidizing endosymbiont of Gigantopelta aegis TaxID=2794934 RepID=UPI001FE66DB9|nr:hybrid sensor histidine kinase/response regulator [sulfur-oxidizing endosymbiont of Gigantopelta aegis]
MSHEIRTPMNAIIGFSDIVLQDETLSKESRNYVKTIANSSRSLMGLINDILDVSKLESGKLDLETVCFHLPNALADALKTLSFHAQEKNLHLKIEYASSLSTFFLGDPSRLRQIILNLVGNAIKFTEKGLVTIAVQNVVKNSEESDMINFSISDTGIGMNNEQLSRVFDSFSQADEGIARRFGGTGLGTTISKQIVELMSGEIWAESELGVGSIFYFTVQMREAKDISHCLFAGDASLENNLVKTKPLSPRLFKVLLAEDIEANATLAILRLEHQGHQVHWVKNGEDAIEESQKNDYDLILMDLLMPEKTGIEATLAIRELEKQSNFNTGSKTDSKHITIIALTAGLMGEKFQQCFDAGIDDIVEKPVNFDYLFDVMESIVPEGLGKRVQSEAIRIAEINKYSIDFSSLNGLVDYKKALYNWQKSDVYLRALIDFSQRHVDDAVKIRDALNDNLADLKRPHEITHTLKGLAGNLGMFLIVDLSVTIDEQLNQQQTELIAASVRELDVCLNSISQAINKLKSPGDNMTVIKNFDKEKVQHLVAEFLSALDELNPDVIEPVLEELAEYIVAADLLPIRKEINVFDFDKAAMRLEELAQKLELR